MTTPIPQPDLETLLRLFYGDPAAFGVCREVSEGEVPQPYRGLLAHDEHMTEVMERHHGSPVDVQVLAVRHDGSHYSRKILLRRRADGLVVQFGIVRLDFACLSDPVRAEIENQSKPLGRILIEHDVLRRVRLSQLWRIQPAAELQAFLVPTPPPCIYGRTALIYTNEHPAVELLEVALNT